MGEECTRELLLLLNSDIEQARKSIEAFDGLMGGLEQRYEAVAAKLETQLGELQGHREQIENVIAVFRVAMLPMQERLVLDGEDSHTREMWELLGGSANNQLILKSKMQQLSLRFQKEV